MSIDALTIVSKEYLSAINVVAQLSRRLECIEEVPQIKSPVKFKLK